MTEQNREAVAHAQVPVVAYHDESELIEDAPVDTTRTSQGSASRTAPQGLINSDDESELILRGEVFEVGLGKEKERPKADESMNQASPINAEHLKSQFADDLAVSAVAIALGCRSISTDDELPESLKYLGEMRPGLLFWHTAPSGKKTPQYRPDNPKDGHKYIFPKNSGSVLSVNPTMTAERPIVVIVEGTKQMIFAAAYAPDDVRVVGIQGCWAWSSDGQAVAELDELVQGHDVIIIFDADISSNPNVYDAGASLSETLDIIGAKSVRFALIPGGKSVGLDDFLGRRPVGNRSSAFAEILAKGVPLSKLKKPAKRKVTVDAKDATFDFVSRMLGEICVVEYEKRDDNGTLARHQEGRPVAGEVDGRLVRRVETLLYACVTVDTVVATVDDLTVGSEPTYLFDLGVQIGNDTEAEHHTVQNVPSSDLQSVRRWLDRVGVAGLKVELGRIGQGMAGGIRIAEAIRADMKTFEPRRRILHPYSGWSEFEGEYWWSDTSGSHGATRKRDDVKAKLEGPLAPLDVLGWFENYSETDLFAALDKLFAVENYLYDSTVWVAGVSALAWALLGGDPAAVFYIVGEKGSGKTSIAGLLSSFLSPRWGIGLMPMASADASAPILRDLARQPHNMMLVVDDVRGRSSSHSQDAQADALEALIRPGYSGGAAGAIVKIKNAKGEWVLPTPRDNHFFLCVVGEELPEVERQSTIERCLVVEVDTATSLKPAGPDTPTGLSGFQYLNQLSRDNALAPVTSAFLATTADRIGQAGGLGNWGTHLSKERTKLTTDAVTSRISDATPRVVNVAGTFVSGATMFLEWVRDMGYFDDERKVVIEKHWHDLIIEAANLHATTNLNPGGEAEVIISSVVDAVASGRYAVRMGKNYESPTQILVGFETNAKIDGVWTECIALFPSIVAQIVGGRNLPARLDKLLIRDGGKRTKRVKFGDLSPRCFVIRKSDLCKLDPDAPEATPSEASSDDY